MHVGCNMNGDGQDHRSRKNFRGATGSAEMVRIFCGGIFWLFPVMEARLVSKRRDPGISRTLHQSPN